MSSLEAANQLYALVPQDFISAGIDTTRWSTIIRPTFTLHEAFASLISTTVIRLETETGKGVGAYVTKITKLEHDEPIYGDLPHPVAIEAIDIDERIVRIRAVRSARSNELDEFGHITWQYADETRHSDEMPGR